MMSDIRKRVTLAVPRKVLIIAAGLMWCGAGVMLSIRALIWLTANEGISWPYAAVGIIAALLINHLGFKNIVTKNIARIAELPERHSLFAFISVKSYLTIIIMIALGIILRNSPIPKKYLALIYITMGMSLLLSGVIYFRQPKSGRRTTTAEQMEENS